ncbi:SusC/RagA family TonB-linked outer membrane protein [Olivibacter sitiensis]|uniref:SusC/RagA family TonB-linked outer membrane protein n=1 Tax=Olivibacter sitiensis TaxID=376470 RepID=UPI0003F7DC55|nr:SusC/RagA family TonB-linked outer membrane protein [Olivibacter sitiensis]
MKKRVTFFILLWFCSYFSYAQQNRITGIVTDSDGQVLPGISVIEKGTKNAVQTDTRGQFTITLNGSSNTLAFSMIGFQTKEVNVSNTQEVTVVLLENRSDLDEVVVVGYQQQSIKKTTSAVQTITGKQIENLPAPSFETLLQGRVAGVNIQNFTGEPGVRNTFTVRGNTTISGDLNTDNLDLANTMSSPLFIIDGMPVSVTDLSGSTATGTNYIAGINVNDIESIVIQKDAAATAVWGSRGANGVIVIKTKKGLMGKPTVRFSSYVGATQRPELQNTLAGAEERRLKMGIFQEYGSHAQLSDIPQVLTDSLNPNFNNATDWQDLFYRTGSVQNYDVNISAGTDILNYRLAFNHYNEDGIVRNSGFKRYTMRGNFDFRLFPNARTNLIVAASRMDRKRGLGRGVDEIVPITASSMPSSFVKLTESDYDFYYGQYDKLRDDNQSDAVDIFSQTDIDLFKGIKYSLQASVQAKFDRRDRFQPAELSSVGESFASSNRYENYKYNVTNILNWGKTFADTHTIALTGMQAFEYDNIKSVYAYGSYLPTDDVQVVQGVAQRYLDANSNLRESGLISYLGQFSYDYKEKYIVNASWRADGSSRFGANTKWGYFPAASVAWLASEENFLKPVEWIELLKFRGSYGLSGTLPSDYYAPYNSWNMSSTTYDGNSIATPNYGSNPLTQPDLTWNKSKQTNIGADIYLFKNRLNITTDFYRKETIDPIMAFDFPFYTGYTRLSYNVPMTILNEGIELTINTRNLNASSKLQWSTNLNISYNKNRLGSLPNGNRSFYGDSRGFNQQLYYNVGDPIYQWAQLIYTGQVYNRLEDIPVNPANGQRLSYYKTYNPVQPGFPVWSDVNGDWDVWSDSDTGNADGDLVPTGDPNPKFTGGLYNEFTWKNFSLGILGTFTFDRDIINTLMANQFSNIWNYGSTYTLANQRLPDLEGLNYWTPSKAEDPNFNADFPSISPYGPNYYQFLPFSTMWNENGSYFKIKTITVGYFFNSNMLSRLGIKGARVYGIMDNVHIFQSSRVPDAELVSPQGEYTGGSYPLPKKFTFGVEVTL